MCFLLARPPLRRKHMYTHVHVDANQKKNIRNNVVDAGRENVHACSFVVQMPDYVDSAPPP